MCMVSGAKVLREEGMIDEPIPVAGNPSPMMRCEEGSVDVPFVKSKPVPIVSSTPPVGSIASVRPTFLVD